MKTIRFKKTFFNKYFVIENTIKMSLSIYNLIDKINILKQGDIENIEFNYLSNSEKLIQLNINGIIFSLGKFSNRLYKISYRLNNKNNLENSFNNFIQNNIEDNLYRSLLKDILVLLTVEHKNDEYLIY